MLKNFAESIDDGRLPLRSIWFKRMKAAALNMRCKTTDSWSYDEEIYLFCSQILNCDGARSAYEFSQGPRGKRRGKRKSREFEDLVTERVNDPSLPSRIAVPSDSKIRDAQDFLASERARLTADRDSAAQRVNDLYEK